MPKYVIERRIADAGSMTKQDLKAISEKSNHQLSQMTGDGKHIQWLHSYVVDDAIHCVYIASDPHVIAEHARCAGFPADRISEVRAVIDPATGE